MITILTGGWRVLVLDTVGNLGTSASQVILMSLKICTVKEGDTVKFTSG